MCFTENLLMNDSFMEHFYESMGSKVEERVVKKRFSKFACQL